MDYRIPNIFLSAFGLKVEKMYRPEWGSNLPQEPKGIYSGMEVVESLEEASKISYLGTPILFPITFLADNKYRRYAANGEIEEVQMGDFTLPAACVISFRRAKIMSKTPMNGGYGTVKEIYGFNDYDITINGFFLPDPAQPQGLTTPLQQEIEMSKWDELACSIKVACHLFNMRDIKAITMEEFNVAPERGRPNVRPFSVRAKSDEEVELILSR